MEDELLKFLEYIISERATDMYFIDKQEFVKDYLSELKTPKN